MSDIVYGDMDQQTLDNAYNAGSAVPNYAEWVDRYEAASNEALAAIPGPRDVPYGPHKDQVLDIFPAAEKGAPIHLFIHGGYWRAFYKERFACAAQGLQPAGATVMVNSYTLCPEVTIDEIVHQCRALIAWIYRNADRHGGDPERIFISGHSAGGHLVAMLMATDWAGHYGLPKDVIKGATPISGLYDLDPIRHCYLQEDLHLDDAQVARMSPVHLPPSHPCPVLPTYGSIETRGFLDQWALYEPVLKAAGNPYEFVEMEGHDHFSIFWELTKQDSPLTQAMLAQMGLG